ncbi:Golgi apparatus membrane protein tvp38 [Aspergillus avenaceus]|uniref:Golgi apparatus membrane protein TVP38 n=1 Tax=Aspergillus avenaceus TaxID=36643 RepID=A0A5N6TG23_ASPAV|nr:Golgi apparatus membrane protein tvp38 [Aspergillus avenaceus]
MPADYQSTARALSLPISPSERLSPIDNDTYPPWSNLTSSRRNSNGLPEATNVWGQVTNRLTQTSRHMLTIWRRMNFWQKVGTVAAALLVNLLGIGFLLFTGKVFIWLGPVAEKWEHSGLAYFVLWLCVFFVSFPPLVGWSTFGTISGYIFGIWKGWFLYASATVLGSTCSFIVSRTILSKFVNRMMERDKRFAALSLTLKYDGLKLLCMIRLCPLPYSVCNGAVSTFPTVRPLMYGLATLIVTPKLLVPAFVGSRIRLLSEKGEEMSTASKAVNVCSIIITVAIGIFTGWYIYRRTMARAKELEAQERAGIRRSLEADHANHRPHQAFSEDPDVNAAATTLARDEEARIGFHDVDDDHVDLAMEDESGSENLPQNRYHDEFTDNDSDDVFKDGDGRSGETYGLHRHV